MNNVMEQASLFRWKATPVWLLLFVLLVVAFAFPWGESDYRFFYVESLPLVAAALLFTVAAFSGGLKISIPPGFYYFGLSAVFVWWQARVLHLPLTGPNDIAAGILLTCGLLFWAVKGMLARYGQEQVLTVVAWLLLAGSFFQAAVSILQLTEWMAPWGGYLFYSGGEPSGQIGQRNQLGHYMMWGLLSASYLWYRKKCPIGWLWPVCWCWPQCWA